ncbi:sensor histidine kinase [Allokutzneria albata]|uniref:histidine kinase n=1 Tax=Allokutzneria albata TaxID=211114 RepID=A0A1G9V734_ALLAB|nr:HAMP domain-containing sensor histidine kinase [Allokutzneria albata]SDM67964.1 Signal transduction histidine kinase [Allokutzneria albata]
MRTRLLLVLLGFSVAVVAAFAVPLLLSTSAERTQRLVFDRTADLDRFATLTEQADGSGDTGQLLAEASRYIELYGEGLLVVDGRGRLVVQAGMSLQDTGVRALVDAALRNQRWRGTPDLRPWSREPLLLARPAGTGTRVTGAVVLRASVTSAANDVAQRWAVVLAGAVAATVAFGALASGLARWVLRPLRELERGVHAVASGEPRAHVEVRGPAELRSLAGSFNRMSDAVTDSLERQRRLVAEASHQLRNPMAALRLRVDGLEGALNPGAERAYQSVVGEVERLESLLDSLLALAGAENKAATIAMSTEDAPSCDVALVVADRLDAWHAAAEHAGVSLAAPEPEEQPLLAGCEEGELAQVLDVLLDNAIKYAGEGSTVRVRHARSGSAVHLEVRDDGPGLTDEEISLATERFWRSTRHQSSRGTGLGLAIADQLARARDGELTVTRATPTGLCVRLELPGVPE